MARVLITFLFSLLVFSFPVAGQANVKTADEFGKIRNTIRESYAHSPTEGLNLVNSLLETDDFSLEQRVMITNYKTWFLFENNQFEDAMQSVVEYKSMVSRLSEKSLMYGYYNLSGGIYSRLGLYEEALNYYNDAIPFARQRNQLLVYQVENNIALIYLELERFKEALTTFENYKLYAQTNNQTLNESFASMNIATALVGLKKYDEAMAVLDALLILQEKHDYITHQSISLVLKGKILRLLGDLEASENVLLNAVNLIKEHDVSSEYMSAILALTATYEAQGKIEHAISLITSIDLDSDKYTHFETQLEVAKFTASLYEKQGNYQNALIAYKQYNDIQTVALKRQASVNLTKALAEADLAAKEVRISELTKTEQIKATKAKAFQDLTIAISMCLFLIIIGSFIAIRSINRQKHKLAATLKRLHDTQSHLIEIEKIASLTSLVSGMAHQLNTPIGTIVTASSLIDKYLTGLSDKFENRNLTSKHFHEFINDTSSAKELVISSVNRLASIVEEFKSLNVSINLDKPMSNIVLLEYMHDRLEPLSIYLGKHIYYEVSGDDVTIMSYPSILGDVLKTLVINSCEHGFIDRDEGKVDIVIKQNAQCVDIIYQDNGVGIKDGILKEIFTPFYTSNMGSQHLGLGLNVVFNAVQYNLKGKICAESSDHGARFIITLPIDVRLVDEE